MIPAAEIASKLLVVGAVVTPVAAVLVAALARGRGLAVLGVAALLMTTRVARAYVLDPIFSPVVSPTVLNSVGIDPETPLTPAEKKGARYYGGLD